jgi:hypothetical protein
MAAANPCLPSVALARISSAPLNLKWIVHAGCENESTPPPRPMRRNEDRCTRLKSLWIYRLCPRRRPNAIHLRDKAGGAGRQVDCPPRSRAPYPGCALLVAGYPLPARQLRPRRREQKSRYVYRASLRREPRRVLVHLLRHRGRRSSASISRPPVEVGAIDDELQRARGSRTASSSLSYVTLSSFPSPPSYPAVVMIAMATTVPTRRSRRPGSPTSRTSADRKQNLALETAGRRGQHPAIVTEHVRQFDAPPICFEDMVLRV